MDEFQLDDYKPYITFASLVTKILDGLDGHTDNLHPISETITQILLLQDHVFDERVRHQYYEYQELYNAMMSFLDFYVIWAPKREYLTYDQMTAKHRAISKTFLHIRNFLSTLKRE